MTPLLEVAFSNLQFLKEKDDFMANRYKIVKNRFVQEDDDTIYTLRELEYPLYFTFHQLMNHVHSSYDPVVKGFTKPELLDIFDQVLDIVNDYYVEINNNDKEFELLIDDIDDKVHFIKQYYKYGWCLRLPTFIKDNFTVFCDTMIQVSSEIVKDYIHEINDLDTSDTDTTDTDSTDPDSTDANTSDDEFETHSSSDDLSKKDISKED